MKQRALPLLLPRRLALVLLPSQRREPNRDRAERWGDRRQRRLARNLRRHFAHGSSRNLGRAR